MTTHPDLVEWGRQQRLESLRQIDLFGDKGVQAFLRMPEDLLSAARQALEPEHVSVWLVPQPVAARPGDAGE